MKSNFTLGNFICSVVLLVYAGIGSLFRGAVSWRALPVPSSVVGPVVDLPLELEREAGRAQLPLPRTRELEPLARRVVEASEIEVPDATVWPAAHHG